MKNALRCSAQNEKAIVLDQAENPDFIALTEAMVPRPGVEPGQKMKTKHYQIHQRKANDFALFWPMGFAVFCSLGPRFLAKSAQGLSGAA
jgi:hypothetical protein